MTSWAEQRREAALELDHARLEAETVACPECEAPVGERCRNVNDGGPLMKAPAFEANESGGGVGVTGSDTRDETEINMADVRLRLPAVPRDVRRLAHRSHPDDHRSGRFAGGAH